MAAQPAPISTSNLEPPRKSVELEDPGAHELGIFLRTAEAFMQMLTSNQIESSADEDYFSDASEGRRRNSRAGSPFRPPSPIPKTRVERVDDKPSYGEVPGSPAYETRLQDAVPDELEIVPEGKLSKRSSRQFLEPTASSGGVVIPRTVVEKVDPSSPSHGDVPGTAAYQKRLADAAPDVVLKSPESGTHARSLSSFTDNEGVEGMESTQAPIPETIITRLDSRPAHGEVGGATAYEMWRQDAEPDDLEHDGNPAAGERPGMKRSSGGRLT
jgi:hypothetical protein